MPLFASHATSDTTLYIQTHQVCPKVMPKCVVPECAFKVPRTDLELLRRHGHNSPRTGEAGPIGLGQRRTPCSGGGSGKAEQGRHALQPNPTGGSVRRAESHSRASAGGNLKHLLPVILLFFGCWGVDIRTFCNNRAWTQRSESFQRAASELYL